MPLLFSYGTLRQANVQMATFGRVLQGAPDELVGFEQGPMKVDDPYVVATSGKSDHTIVRQNGRRESRVKGVVFEITEAELASADRYEPPGYERISTTLASGKNAWVYVESLRQSLRQSPRERG